MARRPRSDPHWKATHDAAESVERSMQRAFDQAVKNVDFGRIEQSSRRAKSSASVAASIDWTSFESDLADRLEVAMFRGASRSARALGDRIPGVVLRDETIRAAAARRAREAAKLIVANTRKGAREAARVARAGGMSPRRVAGMVRSTFGLLEANARVVVRNAVSLIESGTPQDVVARRMRATSRKRLRARAKGIAEFESLFAAQSGSHEVMNQAETQGVARAVEKGWVTLRDGLQDPICDRLHGQRVGMREKYVDPETGKRYGGPPQPHKGCRCGEHYFFQRKRSVVSAPLGRLPRVSAEAVQFTEDVVAVDQVWESVAIVAMETRP